jgi:hypothetical protein
VSVFDFERCRWRTGRKVGRTIYAMLGDEPSDRDVLIGMMDRPAIAAEAVDAHNAKLDWKPPVEPLAAATAEVRTILLDEWCMDHLVVDDDGDEELARRVLVAAGVVDR